MWIDERALKDLQDRLKRLENITAGPGITLQKVPGGIVVSASAKAEAVSPSKVQAPDSPEIVITLQEEWDSAIPYRELDWVTYKPEGARYSYLYQANTADITANDIPGTSNKWVRITDVKDEWDAETAYSPNDEVMDGTPWQMYVYTCTEAATGSADRPSTGSAKWAKGEYVNFGIAEWPAFDPDFPEDPDKNYSVPYLEEVAVNSYFNPADGKLTLHMRQHIHDADGNMVIVIPGRTITIDTAQEHS